MGREGRGGEGGSIDTQLWKLSILRWEGRGGEGRGVNQHSTLKGSTKTLEGLPLTMLILGSCQFLGGKGGEGKGGGSLNFERIHKDFGRIASDNVDPGGQSTLNFGSCQFLGGEGGEGKGGGRSTLNFERIHKDFGRIASDNVDPGGSINTQLWKLSILRWGGRGGEGRGG